MAPTAAPGLQPWALRHLSGIRALAFVLSLLPGAWLCGEALTDSLGAHPLNRLLHVTGHSAMALLLVTLAITPLRRLSAWMSRRLDSARGKRLADWSWLIRLRRMFGLFVFAYACAHLWIYVWLDVGPSWPAVVDDVRERPFIALGAAAWLLLVPLAATSTAAAMKRLGRHWRTLHRLVHAVLLLVLAHGLMQLKVGESPAWLQIAVAGVLLAARAWPRRATATVPPERRSAPHDSANAADSAGVPSIEAGRPVLDSSRHGLSVPLGTRTSR